MDQQQCLQETILPFAAHHDYCFSTSTNLYCFLHWNYAADFLHVMRSLTNQSCSYATLGKFKFRSFKEGFIVFHMISYF
jgi:hypothetical protein